IRLKVLERRVGEKDRSATQVYTKVFALDVAVWRRMQFAMPESDAVVMLKQLS
ncbi:resolvase, partial [Escherichia coli]